MKIPKIGVTFWLIAICVIVFIIQQFTNITDTLSFTPATALSQPWTFVTAIFLHANYLHILLNMIALFFFGIYLEKIISKRSYLLIFFLAGIIGNVWYMVTATDPTISAIGASGAIYGIMGTLAVLKPKSIVLVYGIPMPMFVAAILWFGLNFFGLLGPDIGYGAHIGGLVFGIAAGFYFRYRLRKNVLIFKQTY